jgi:hypothetical protein
MDASSSTLLNSYASRCWLVPPAAAGVKVERPTGRTTLTPARTGAGSGGEKARTTSVGVGLACTHSGPGVGSA